MHISRYTDSTMKMHLFHDLQKILMVIVKKKQTHHNLVNNDEPTSAESQIKQSLSSLARALRHNSAVCVPSKTRPLQRHAHFAFP